MAHCGRCVDPLTGKKAGRCWFANDTPSSEYKETKSKGNQARSVKDVGSGNTDAGTDLRSLQGSTIEASAPSIPEVQVSASALRPKKRGRTVRQMPLSDPLRSDIASTADHPREGRRTGGTNGGRDNGPKKEPIQPRGTGKHPVRAKGGVK
jgi:hypothetical protein